MNNNVIPFTYESHEVRVIKDEDGNPWWVAKDVCGVLSIVDHNKAVKALDDDEKGAVKVPTPLGGPQEMSVINEPGLYTLIIRSNKPEAKKFKRWITHEVLPSIRANGYYMPQEQGENPVELILKKHFGIRINQRLRLLEMAYRMNDMNPTDRTQFFTDFDMLCGGFGSVAAKGDDDLLGDYISECCRTGAGEISTATELYDDYCEWFNSHTNDTGRRVLSQKSFGNLMGARFKKFKSGTIRYVGISLNSRETAKAA